MGHLEIPSASGFSVLVCVLLHGTIYHGFPGALTVFLLYTRAGSLCHGIGRSMPLLPLVWPRLRGRIPGPLPGGVNPGYHLNRPGRRAHAVYFQGANTDFPCLVFSDWFLSETASVESRAYC